MSETKPTIYAAAVERLECRSETHSLRLRLLELRAAKGQGPKGERGERGPPGPKPDHRWIDTSLQFEKPSGEWGELVELRGPRGFMAGGAGGTVIVNNPTPTTSDGSVPYFIAADEVYEVPIYRQAVFARTIECDGIIDLSGDLIMCD